MKTIVFLLVFFLLHLEASDDTQVGTFDVEVSSEKVKIGKKYKAPIEEVKTYNVDINENEIEELVLESPKLQIQNEEIVEEKKEAIVIKQEPIKIDKTKKQKGDVSQKEFGGIVLPFDKVDDKDGVVLPMD